MLNYTLHKIFRLVPIRRSRKFPLPQLSLYIISFLLFSRCAEGQSTFADRLSDAAISLTTHRVQYDPSYFRIDYPMGDVPENKGVCTDVVIRAYRKMGIDLQQKVHEDMRDHFSLYPNKWGLRKTDKNIDHRRVPNLMTFFSRFGREKTISQNPKDYSPGDIVCWNLGGGITHIGIVVKKKSADGRRHMIVHNIGAGQVLEDCLFNFTLIGHYAYGK